MDYWILSLKSVSPLREKQCESFVFLTRKQWLYIQLEEKKILTILLYCQEKNFFQNAKEFLKFTETMIKENLYFFLTFFKINERFLRERLDNEIYIILLFLLPDVTHITKKKI